MVEAPPRTTILEAAGDVLNPPLPNIEFLTDPSSRPRTIFHDRVYHAEDIPEIPPNASPSIEEKIARAYHKDLSWRKVLVRLEPDAHNNMVVRRMFANAYGWPVIKHVVETHFGGSWKAQTPDDEESSAEGASITPPNGEAAVAAPAPARRPMATAGVGAVARRRSETGESLESSSWTSDAFLLTDEDWRRRAPRP